MNKHNNLNVLRVHIAAVGFEVDRIVLPAISLKADKIWLITHSNPTEDKGFKFISQIKKKLQEIECLETSADRKDLFDTLRVLRSIISQENGNNIMVNVSTGSKIQSIASMMACMMFRDLATIRPYYVEPQNYKSDPNEQETEGLKEIIPLPDYKIEIPHKKLIKCLELIEQTEKGQINKKKLKDSALSEKLIHVDERKENKETAAYMALNKNILEPLQNWNFINIEKIGKSKLVSLSNDGKNALKFLRES